MKEVMAVIRMNMINRVKKALSDGGITSVTVKDCLGRGKGLVDTSVLKGAELGYEEAIAQLGQSNRLIPKRLLIIVVPDEMVKRVVEVIISTCRTGSSGDGKLFVVPCSDTVSVRTGESGEAILDEYVNAV